MSPVKTLVYILAAIFCAELLIMFALRYAAIEHSGFKMLIDALVLSIVVYPVLYFGLFRPLSRKNRTLQDTQQQLRRAQQDLEAKVQARTAELQSSNETIKRSLELVETQNRQMGLLGRMVRFFQTCKTPEEAYHVAADHLQRLFPEAPAALYQYRPSRESLERVVKWNTAQDFCDFFEPDDCWALRRAAAHQNFPGRLGLRCRHYSVPDGSKGVCLPVSANGETFGVLCVVLALPAAAAAAADGRGQEEAPAILTAISENLALTIANIRFRDTLHSLAVRDELTGLYNRRFLDETMELELQRALRQNEPFSLIMVDIDHFKQFNDTEGHEAGDRVLAEIGRLMRQRLRKGDIPCRYGGEEFSILMPKVEARDAFERAEQLRRGVAALPIPFDGKLLGPVTISCGIAAFPMHADEARNLIRAADQALYRSKARGRNQSTLAEVGETAPDARQEPEAAQRLAEGS